MYWFIAAVVLIVLEVMIGTFYFLVLAAALTSVGLVEWLFGTSLSVNLALFAALSFIGIPLARRFQKKRAVKTQAGNRPLDIGQVAVIEKHLHHNVYQVKYRGTIWQAQLEQGSAVSGQTVYIYARHGNVLQVQAQNSPSSES